MEKPLVSIVICTYGRASSLRSYSFPALANLTYPNYEVIVVNDGSKDDTQSFLKTCEENMANLLVLNNDKNRGLCYSRNRGVAHAKGEFIVFTDDDVSLFPDCLDELVKVYQENSEVTAIWGCVYQYGSSWEKGTETYGTGSLMSFRRFIFNRFRFDTNLRYFNSYACDEHELMRRIQRQDFKIIKVKQAQADHFHAPAENRALRGIGGDLNYLYENLKFGSIFEYYGCFIMGLVLPLKRLISKSKFEDDLRKHPYQQVIETPIRLVAFIQNRQFDIAIKWIFYVLIDIPFRAKTKNIVEL
ncbi:glycosyltransferase family 2 protein [Nostoc flagelliforme FACHB-838]|uniref:Glycosyltransferase family 2 protein n=1 Tax=Nostoc flagelliforme FACHB-838 TaxID=2692904 RepID=A0ABR8DM10_9NOSO|nr:glycosyltransferase family 2 protein [Nostoc flagelliforme]MBD2530073.1 glycosyltransferase family 2 protein [Nostoc flagelliforme FACHB-838]